MRRIKNHGSTKGHRGLIEMDKPHKKLDVWRTSMAAAQTVYKITSTFPEEEKFGLISQ